MAGRWNNLAILDADRMVPVIWGTVLGVGNRTAVCIWVFICKRGCKKEAQIEFEMIDVLHRLEYNSDNL